VSAAGAIAGEQALQIATIVKTTQNALLGVVAVALTTYFALPVERRATAARPVAAQLWESGSRSSCWASSWVAPAKTPTRSGRPDPSPRRSTRTRHRALALHDEHVDLHAELIAAELAHQLAMARRALHRHPPLRPAG
jgi:hypothetical protein